MRSASSASRGISHVPVSQLAMPDTSQAGRYSRSLDRFSKAVQNRPSPRERMSRMAFGSIVGW